MIQTQTRNFRSTAILERLKKDYRIKEVPKKTNWVNPTIRDDFIFLYNGKARAGFPYHDLDLAMKILRLCAVRQENVQLFFRLNLNGKDVRLYYCIATVLVCELSNLIKIGNFLCYLA